MKVIKTNISDVVILEPRVFGDERGYFFESFSQREFNEQVAEVTFVQDNESKSSYGPRHFLFFERAAVAAVSRSEGMKILLKWG